MALAFYPRISLDKPVTGAKADFAHPLANGLVGHWAFTEGSGVVAFDSSTNANHGVFTTARWVIGRAGQWCPEFDGSSNYVQLPGGQALQITGPITLSAWIFLDDLGATNGAIVSKFTGSPNWCWELVLDDNPRNNLMMRISSNGTTVFSAQESTEFAEVGTWTFVAGTYIPSTSVNIYKNGLQVAINTTSIPATQFNNTQNPRIGIRPNGGAPFDGKIDDVRIYNRGLSSAEIWQLYTDTAGIFLPPKRRFFFVAAGGQLFTTTIDETYEVFEDFVKVQNIGQDESASFEDALGKALSKNLDETYSFEDAIEKTFSKNIDETYNVEEQTLAARYLFADIAESIDITEAVEKVLSKSVDEEQPIEESIVKMLAKILTEDYEITETLISQALGRIIQVFIDEQYDINEDLVKFLAMGQTEQISVEDAVTKILSKIIDEPAFEVAEETAKTLLKEISETQNVDESVVKILSRIIDEPIFEITEEIVKVLMKEISENQDASESIIKVLSKVIDESAFEVIEETQAFRLLIREVVESWEVTEEVIKILLKEISEVQDIDESVIKVLSKIVDEQQGDWTEETIANVIRAVQVIHPYLETILSGGHDLMYRESRIKDSTVRQAAIKDLLGRIAGKKDPTAKQAAIKDLLGRITGKKGNRR